MLPAQVFILFTLYHDSLQAINFNCVVDYFDYVLVSEVHVFLCASGETSGEPTYMASVIAKNHLTMVIQERSDLFVQSLTTSYHRVGVFVDFNCPESYSVIKQSSEGYLFNKTYSWLIWPNNNLAQLVQILNQSNLAAYSDVTLVDGSSMYEAFKIHQTTFIKTNLIGHWTPETKFVQNYSRADRNNLEGLRINATTVLLKTKPKNISELPGKLLDWTYMPEQDDITRYMLTLFYNSQGYFNFTTNYIVTDTWGYPFPNGTFSGMMGKIEQGLAEFCLSICDFRIERYRIVNYINIVRLWQISFLFKQPRKLGSATALLMPISTIVWQCLGAMVIIIAIAYKVAANRDPEVVKMSYSASLTSVVGVMADQGFMENLTTFQARTIGFSLLMFSFLVITFYNAEVLNSLLSPSPNAINNIDQLIDNKLKFAIWNVPYLTERMERNDSVTKRILKKSKRYGGVLKVTKNDVLGLIRSGKYAVFVADETFYGDIFNSFSGNEVCSLTAMAKEAKDSNIQTALVSSKTSPFREHMAQVFLLMHERGIIQREIHKWWRGKPKCLYEQETVPVNIESVAAALGTLAIGVISAFISFIGEILSHKLLVKTKLKATPILVH